MLKKNSDNMENQNSVIDRYIKELAKKEKEIGKRYKQGKRHMYKRNAALKLGVVLLLAVVLFFGTTLVLDKTGVCDFKFIPDKVLSVDAVQQSTGVEEIPYTEPNRPTKIFATTVFAGSDFGEASTLEEKGLLIDNVKAKGLTTIFVNISGEKLFIETENGKKAFEDFVTLAASKEMSVFAVLDLNSLSPAEMLNPDTFTEITNRLYAVAKTEGLSGIMVKGAERQKNGADFGEYLTLGNFMGYKKYSEQVVTNLVKEIRYAVKSANPTLYLGIICDDIYASTATSEVGLATNGEAELLKDKNADVLLWLREKYFDGVFINCSHSTEGKTPSFTDVARWWSDNLPEGSDMGFMLLSTEAVKGEGIFKNPDQITRQLMSINTLNRYTFCFNSFSAMENDKTEASSVAYKYLSGGIEEDYILSNLTITSPKKKSTTVYDNIVSFVGASDPNFKISLNGEALERTEYGYFSLTKELKVGKNTFTFEHKGAKETYTVNYKYVVIKSHSPSGDVTMDSGSTLIVKVLARNGSKVTATFNGQTVTMEKSQDEKDTDFATYVGAFTLGEYYTDTPLGAVTFKGTHNGVTDTFKSGKVTVRKKPGIVDGVIPPSHEYISVGNNLIAKVIKRQIETFSGNTYDDLSQPFNNYLPLGTVDYCSEGTSYDPDSKNTYRTLRCGRRVYAKESKGNIEVLRGTLPSFNTLKATSVTTSGQYTVLTLNSMWHAPFILDYAPQGYLGGTSDQRGSITGRTFKYIDIKFCYATSFEGDLEEFKNSPIFSSAEIIKGSSDYTLRLHLKKMGKFYGWSAQYDGDGNLVFKFLNPIKAQPAANSYGGTLNGITIVIDAGHGGSDGGAVGSNPRYDEADRNLYLAQILETKLRALGAKVVMTRSADVALSQDERMNIVRNANANLAISVHRNGSTSSKVRGFGSYYFYPFTQEAADCINRHTAASGNYTSSKLLWHYFYLSRISDCPVVLTENGFMSNASDFNNMLSQQWNESCADAIVKGVVEYFLNIE